MKTMKKVLCVLLSLAMVLGMTAMAFAADEVELAYPTAVKVMTALKVLIGDEEGKLNLQENLTREQAAKLVAYFYAGYVKAEKSTGVADFADVASDRWSTKYVALCAKEGIINGYNETTFGPEDYVTGLQFGKMLLACLGYDELTGQAWDAKTTELLDAAGLTNFYTLALTREAAAQLCFEALKANVVKDGKEVKNLAYTETIANDDVMQLGEKLYPTLTLAKSTDGYLWSLNGKSLDVTEPFAEFVPEECDDAKEPAEKAWTYPLIGVNFIQKYDYKTPGLLSLVFNPIFSRLNARNAANIKYLSDVLQAENMILFSTDGEHYAPFLTAKAGEKVFVKTNNFSFNLFDYIDGALPETIVSKTAAKTLTRDDFVNLEKSYEFNIGTFTHSVAKVAVPYNTVGLFDAIKTSWDTQFHNAVLKLIDNFDEKFNRDDLIELHLVKEPANGQPAVYCFAMPNRAVTTYDFATGAVRNITFFNTTLVPKTVFMKNGEFGDLQQIVVNPLKAVTVTEPATAKTYFSSDANTWFVGEETGALASVKTTRWGETNNHHGLIKLWNLVQDNLGRFYSEERLTKDMFEYIEFEDAKDQLVFLTSPLLDLIPDQYIPRDTTGTEPGRTA